MSASATAANITGAAAVGVLGVGVQNGNVSLLASTGVTANGSNGQVSLKSLTQSGTTQLNVQPIHATLTGTLPLSVTGVNLGLSSTPSLSLSLGKANDLTTVTATPNAALQSLLNGFANLTPSDVGQSLQTMSTSLLQDPIQGAASLLGAFNTPLPLINKSLNDLLGTSTVFITAASILNQASNLASLEAAVQNVLQSVVTGSSPVASTGILSADATFTVVDDGQQPVSVTVTATSTQNDQSVADLVNVINTAMANARVTSAVTAGQNSQGEITFTDSNGNLLQITASASNSLGLATQASGLALRAAIVSLPTNVDTTALIRVAEDLTSANATSTTAIGLSSAIIAATSSLSAAISTINTNYPTISTASLAAVLSELQSAATSLQNLSAAISSALGISAPNTLTIQFVNGPPTSGTDEAIEIGLTLNPSYSQAVQLSSLALPSLGPLTFSGTGSVMVNIGGTANLNFGYDLTTNTPFLLGSTSFALTAKIASSNLTLSGDIGSVAIGIGNSSNPASITLTDAAGDANSAASVSIRTTASPTAWIPLSQITASTFQSSTTGGLFSAVLPIYVGPLSVGNPLTVALNLQNPTQPTITLPQNLQSVLDNGGFDFSQFVGASGIGGFLSNLQSSIQSQLLQLPLIGHDLNLGSGFINDLAQDFVTPLQTALNNLTDPNALQQTVINVINNCHILAPGSGNVTVSTDALDITFEVKGSNTYTTSFNANLGGLGLNVSTKGGVALTLGYDLHLGFELSKTQGFSLMVQPDAKGNAFSFTVSAGLTPGTHLQAKLFFLNVSATNETVTGNGAGTAINGSLAFNIGSGKMSFDQFTSNLLSSIVTANLAADINLHLSADVDPTLPGITADLSIHFPIVADTSGGVGGDVGNAAAPSVALDNITLSFGSFIDKLVGPVINDVDSVLAPIKPILDFLAGDVPGISKITEFAGLGPVTWTDMLEAIAAYAGVDVNFPAFNSAIHVLDEVAGFASDITQLSTSGGIDFGNFSFTADVCARLAVPIALRVTQT